MLIYCFVYLKNKSRVVDKIDTIYTCLRCNLYIAFLKYIFNTLEKDNIIYENLVIDYLVVAFLLL